MHDWKFIIIAAANANSRAHETHDSNKNQFQINSINVCMEWITLLDSRKEYYTDLGDLPVANVLQIVGDVVGHLFGEVFKVGSFHVDLKHRN